MLERGCGFAISTQLYWEREQQHLKEALLVEQHYYFEIEQDRV